MATSTSTSVTCGECDYAMDPIVAQDPDRSPCPRCGSPSIGIAVGIVEEINIASGLDIGVGPADYARHATRRWEDADAEAHALEQPLPDSSRETLLDAQRRLYAAFIDLWSLREALIAEDGIARRSVDDVIEGSAVIALAHDLGNVAKHGSPLRHLRSGHQPIFHQPLATRAGSGGPWRFRLDVEHDGTTADGVGIARRAIDEWRDALTDWGLL